MATADSPAPPPPGWEYPDSDEAESLAAEFRRELPPGHRLYGRRVELVAARVGTDDVLFRHPDEPGRLTVIHLTWLGREEIDADHPWVEFDGDAAGFWAWERSWHGGSHADAESRTAADRGPICDN
jgi:hypothetical protein